ncbi:MAG: hypothetical protein A3B89_00235 [Candidatus Buchananbacteria bacterium RIFCSPHIGHO2_02_FULL_40_13]|uniref:Uncharacterized protein n=1 Tax=Candidatus Buchananbacteria bacterium RIFCSPLOWO2_01_FULL_39_33 TaxID=1797543 RepID=A0A1G1YJ42_9BACT|nr:MAG: hypothetical protein A2820_03115 [Candidatus Buchananbacteria bacterium RIFCSPHIGHO2_01_FULL_40_35]OGY49505.1 MAG: hypothetical protein A3B89_00235 [Candidatus Buchananbacteria bacterium RIFCSPHIGHO2_02_FULL_40_13]OGY51720.1 MAG: hypothetical protein A3A02_02415 [Candidatus Buchananbacteria bacterium RIFCSPLOWO2_01_FULL_39_33]
MKHSDLQKGQYLISRSYLVKVTSLGRGGVVFRILSLEGIFSGAFGDDIALVFEVLEKTHGLMRLAYPAELKDFKKRVKCRFNSQIANFFSQS